MPAEQAEKPEAEKKPGYPMHKRRYTPLYTIIVFLYGHSGEAAVLHEDRGPGERAQGPQLHPDGQSPVPARPGDAGAVRAGSARFTSWARKSCLKTRSLGWVFRQVHGFPVDRGNMDMGAIRTAMGVLKEGETLGIFPEGTRSRTGHMLPLLGGASLLALKSGCDVVPVYIEGSYKPFHRMMVHVGRAGGDGRPARRPHEQGNLRRADAPHGSRICSAERRKIASARGKNAGITGFWMRKRPAQTEKYF